MQKSVRAAIAAATAVAAKSASACKCNNVNDYYIRVTASEYNIQDAIWFLSFFASFLFLIIIITAVSERVDKLYHRETDTQTSSQKK